MTPDHVRIPIGGVLSRDGAAVGTAELSLTTKPTADDFASRIEELEAEIAALRARCVCGN
ncbi:MAG TPA: hypothetical protein VGB52_06265 [Actinomycetota bacterium]